jgi:hypothetical protein
LSRAFFEPLVREKISDGLQGIWGTRKIENEEQSTLMSEHNLKNFRKSLMKVMLFEGS